MTHSHEHLQVAVADPTYGVEEKEGSEVHGGRQLNADEKIDMLD